MVERLLIKYHRIFARHRLDIGINNDFKNKLTPKDDEPVYAQNLTTPANLKDEIHVELALQQEFGTITTLPFNKYSSPIFVQREPNGKLRILIELRRINHLIKHDYNERNHPLTTIAEAAQPMTGKKYFCKLDCSEAYHCLQMTDEQWIQLLSLEQLQFHSDNRTPVQLLIHSYNFFARHPYLPKHILTDKGSAFTFQVLTELKNESGIKINHAILKHATFIGMVERNHQELKQILKINVAVDKPHWDRYVNLVIMADSTM